MAQGRYTRRRRRRLNPRFVILVLILITLLALLGTLALRSCRREEPESTQPPTSEMTQPSTRATTAPTTVPTTAATTVPTTAATTEPTTEATTEATTGPTTEATTVPTTAPPTEPPTEPTTAPTEPPVPASSAVGAQVAELAKAQLGKPYAYGGVGPDSFDASGLAVYCYSENGVTIPRTTTYQAQSGSAVPRHALEPGDILIFWSENPGEAEYEGIYIGGGKFIAARHGDNPVSEMDLNTEYFSTRYLGARRYG